MLEPALCIFEHCDPAWQN